MGNLASLTFMLGANIGDFQTNMRKASKVMKDVGGQMKDMGGKMSLYVTAPLTALGAASVAAFDEADKAEKRLAAQLRQNGKDVQAVVADYKNYAASIQKITTIDDDAVLGLMQLAESMQAVDTKAATSGAIALSKALGVDMETAVKMAVQAQNGQYTMLQRLVPAIKNAGSETEKAAILTKLYSDGLAIAQAETQAGLGPLLQLKNSFSDLQEEFGKIIAEGMKPVVEFLRMLVEGLQRLTPEGKKAITIIAGIAAVAGPLLIALGGIVTIAPAVATAFTIMTGPVGLVAGALLAVGAAFVYIYENWQAFKERMTSDWPTFWGFLKDIAITWAQDLIKIYLWPISEIAKAFGVDFKQPIIDVLESLRDPVDESKTQFKGFFESIGDFSGDMMQKMGLFGAQVAETFQSISTGAKTASGDINKAEQSITKMASAVADINNIASDIKPGIIDTPRINKEIDKAFNAMTFKERFRKLEMDFKNDWESVTGSMQQMIAGAITELAITIGEALGDVISGIDPNFGSKVLSVLGSFLKQIGGFMISYGALMLAMTILMNNPWTAVAAIAIGIAAVAAGQILMNQSKKGPAKMAQGGIVPSGFDNDTYPAFLTSGEMVLPKPIVLGMMGGGGESEMRLRGEFVQRGNDLVAVAEKFDNYRTRTRGF
jgi:hypothetical protein